VEENKLYQEIVDYLTLEWFKLDSDLKITSIEEFKTGKKINYSYDGVKFGCYITPESLSFFFYNEFNNSDLVFWKSKYKFTLLLQGLNKDIFDQGEHDKPEVIMERNLPCMRLVNHDCRFILIMARFWNKNLDIEKMETEAFNAIINKK
jgi:hypothetical protein